MKKDILNHLGEKIGELEEPQDGLWSDEEWQLKLSFFSKAPEPETIKDVTPRQIRQALVLSGLSLNTIDTFLENLPEPTKSLAKIEWEYSTIFKRDNYLVNTLGIQLGWNKEQLDNLWKGAALL